MKGEIKHLYIAGLLMEAFSPYTTGRIQSLVFCFMIFIFSYAKIRTHSPGVKIQQCRYQSWFQSLPARTVHLAYCQKPQGSLLFGFKVSNDYGGFAQVGYDGIPKKFCSITKGQYDFSTT